MPEESELEITVCDHEPDVDDFRREVLAGLSSEPKRLPSKYFYDQRGSKLFDQICELDEYYPTRTELGILDEHIDEMVRAAGPRSLVVEYGSGSSIKTRILLDHLEDPTACVVIDISREHLREAAEELQGLYPEVEILAVCADFTTRFELPEPEGSYERTLVYFPGSTIGNLGRDDARSFLEGAAALAGSGGGLLIGVDLKKDPEILRAAYNDREGVTAEFNLNLLARINDELEGDFDLDAFEHDAPYNAEDGRVEMHLVSRREQTAHVGGQEFRFRRGERICTEWSHKYDVEQFADLAAEAGWRQEHVWTDDERKFSVQFFVAE